MKEEIQKIIEGYKVGGVGLLDALHELQRVCGNYLPEGAVRSFAEGCGLPLNQVFGVISFYTMFAIRPRGENIIRICSSPPCHLIGAETLIDVLEDELGVKVGGTTADGLFTLELTSCLGQCAMAPAMMVNDEVYGNLTRERVIEILRSYRERPRRRCYGEGSPQ